MEATPAKWKDFKVIYVAGSEILVALTAPTASPAYTNKAGYLLNLFYLIIFLNKNL